jgi:hypothetical protein
MKRANRCLTPVLILICVLVSLTGAPLFRSSGDAAGAEDPKSGDVQEATSSKNGPGSVAEARDRARLLHETLHGALQVMHRDFFDDEEPKRIPSKSLEDVFSELARSHNVKVQWLAVNSEALSIDHKPRNEFEKQAVKALSSGEKEYESVTGNSYRYVGSIKLASQCLKCHLPNRTSTRDRAAGLVITMPLNISESH